MTKQVSSSGLTMCCGLNVWQDTHNTTQKQRVVGDMTPINPNQQHAERIGGYTNYNIKSCALYK